MIYSARLRAAKEASVKLRLLPLALIALLLLAFGAGAVACDDDSEALALEEYFQQLETLIDETNERSDELEEAFAQVDAASLSEAQQLQALADFLAEGVLLIEDSLAEIGKLRPPEAVVAEHNENVEATTLFIAAMSGVSEGIETMGTMDELVPLFEDEGVSQAADRVVDACLQLQAVADKNEIDVDLNCDDAA